MLRRILLLVILFALLTGTLTTINLPVYGTDEPIMFVEPMNSIFYMTEKRVGDTIQINCTVANVTGLAGFSFRLSWDPTLLICTGIQEILFHTVTPTAFWDNIWSHTLRYNNTEGTADYGSTWADLGQAVADGYAPANITANEYPEGKLTAAIITLTIVSEPSPGGFKECSLDLSNTKMGDLNAYPIVHTVNNGYYRLTGGAVGVIDDPTYTWHGDLVVNLGDTLLIRNCQFTVESGIVDVYGTLQIENSTVSIHYTTTTGMVRIWGGNFTLSNSEMLGKISVVCWGTNILCNNSRCPWTQLVIFADGRIDVLNSVVRGVTLAGGLANVYLENSSCSRRCWFFFDVDASSFCAVNCSLDHMCLHNVVGEGDFRFQTGFVERFEMFYEPWSANFTLSNCLVGNWRIEDTWLGGDPGYFAGTIYDSTIEAFYFEIGSNRSENLTLPGGLLDVFELQYLDVTFLNSTINEWEFCAFGNSQVVLSNSHCVGIEMDENVDVTIRDSEISYVQIYARGGYNKTLLAENSTIEQLWLYGDALFSVNSTLKEGFFDFFTLNPASNVTLTLANSSVNHWCIHGGGEVLICGIHH